MARFTHPEQTRITQEPGTYQPGISVEYYGPEPEEANYVTLTGTVDRGGFEQSRPQFGPQWDESLPEPRPALTWIALTGYHEEAGWNTDTLPGWKAVISETASPHYGYQEEWGPDLSIPRNAPAPWDAGLVEAQSRRIYGQI